MTEEKSLTLVVQEKTLGTLVTNALQIKELVALKIEEYSVDNYQGDENQAAKDKAELNNAAKCLNNERIKLEREFMSPFNEFKNIVNDTVSLIETASAKLDAIVKEKVRREKAEKKAKIAELWESKKFTLVPLEKVYNTKWENKSYKLQTIESDIDGIITRIEGDLNALDSFGEDTAQLKGLYLSTLDLPKTLNKGAELKANRERIAEKERRKAEEAARLAREKAAVADESPLSNAEARERAREIRESLAKNAAEAEATPAAPELPKREKEAASEKKYLFNVIAEATVIARVAEMAMNAGMRSVPSLTFEATAAQIEQLKKSFVAGEFAYEKTHFLTLEVKK